MQLQEIYSSNFGQVWKVSNFVLLLLIMILFVAGCMKANQNEVKHAESHKSFESP